LFGSSLNEWMKWTKAFYGKTYGKLSNRGLKPH
jgi:hypothetical protein